MEALQEHEGHIYLVDGTKLLAYIPLGTDAPRYFDHPLRFDRRRRKFDKVTIGMFKKYVADHRTKVTGSRGNTYYVDQRAGTCTCPGFVYHGACKHIRALQEKVA